jgi:hypothetical protein
MISGFAARGVFVDDRIAWAANMRAKTARAKKAPLIAVLPAASGPLSATVPPPGIRARDYSADVFRIV